MVRARVWVRIPGGTDSQFPLTAKNAVAFARASGRFREE
jgi:hypothetical protein